MTTKTTVFGPFHQVLTMDNIPSGGHLNDADLEIVTEAGIRVADGIIIGIGPYKEIKRKGDHLHSSSGTSIALPGYVDAHTHLCWAGSRAKDYALRLSGKTYQEIAASGGGILDTVRKTRAARKKELVEGLIGRLKILAQRGVTTCEVKSGYGLSVEDELKILEAIVEAASLQPVDLIPTCLAAHVRPPEYHSNSEYLNHISEKLLPLVRSKELAHRVDIFIEQGAFSPEEAKKYLLNAKSQGFSVCIHADQFTCGGSRVAAEVCALSADHLEVSGPDELFLLGKASVFPIVLPGACIGLGISYPPARKILDQKLPLVIASDWNPGSAPNGDLVTQAAIMGAAEKLSMAETLRAITSNAALALGLHDRGILKVGMRADFLIYEASSYQEILYHQGSMHPQETIIRGKKYQS